MNKATVLRELQRSLDLTLPFFDLAPAMLAKSYAPGKWTARQILNHLADTELLFQVRARTIIAQPGCSVEGFAPDEWARTLMYGERRLPLTRRLYAVCRETLIEMVDLLPEAIFGREGRHPKYPGYRAWDVVTRASSHNMHHFGQLEAIRDSRPWSPSPNC